MGFIIRGFIWDIPILIFAYVLFWVPNVRCFDLNLQSELVQFPKAPCTFIVDT